jgi:hypothetical protein
MSRRNNSKPRMSQLGLGCAKTATTSKARQNKRFSTSLAGAQKIRKPIRFQ